MRRVLWIFLLMRLPLHSFAMQGGGLSAGKMFDIAHEIEHLKATSHHHEVDGSVHYDDSGESAAHFADHSASQQSASLPPEPTPAFLMEPDVIRLFELVYSISEPFLEDPQRPPASPG